MRPAVFLAILAGASVAVQTSFNAGAQRLIGPFALVAISGLTTGLVGLFVTLILGRPELSTRAVGYSVVSGVLGAIIVGSISVSASQDGVARALSLVIGAQLIFSLVLDRIGLFGAGASEVSFLKVVGVALILAGGVIVVRY
ncbi:MAG: DMT family transporter [Rubrobacteraceae bacterium]